MKDDLFGMHGDMRVGVDEFRITFNKGGHLISQGTDIFKVYVESTRGYLDKMAYGLQPGDVVLEDVKDHIITRKVETVVQSTRFVKDLWMDGLSNTDQYGFNSDGRVESMTRTFREGAVKLRGGDDGSTIVSMVRFEALAAEIQGRNADNDPSDKLVITQNLPVLVIEPVATVYSTTQVEKWMTVANIKLDAILKTRGPHKIVSDAVFRGTQTMYALMTETRSQTQGLSTHGTLYVNEVMVKAHRIN
jgi:hypothetical protein